MTAYALTTQGLQYKTQVLKQHPTAVISRSNGHFAIDRQTTKEDWPKTGTMRFSDLMPTEEQAWHDAYLRLPVGPPLSETVLSLGAQLAASLMRERELLDMVADLKGIPRSAPVAEIIAPPGNGDWDAQHQLSAGGQNA